MCPRHALAHSHVSQEAPSLRKDPSLMPPLSSPGRSGELMGQGRARSPIVTVTDTQGRSILSGHHCCPKLTRDPGQRQQQPLPTVRGQGEGQGQGTVRKRSGWQHREKLASAQDAGSAHLHGEQPYGQARPHLPLPRSHRPVSTLSSKHMQGQCQLSRLLPREHAQHQVEHEEGADDDERDKVQPVPGVASSIVCLEARGDEEGQGMRQSSQHGGALASSQAGSRQEESRRGGGARRDTGSPPAWTLPHGAL